MDEVRFNKLHKAIMLLIENSQDNLNRTKIVKLLFLADLKSKNSKQIQTTISGIKYQRYLYGPYSDNIIKALDTLKGYEIDETQGISSSGRKFFSYNVGQIQRSDLSQIKFNDDDELDKKMSELIIETSQKYGGLSTNEILNEVYALPQFKKTEFGKQIML